MQTNNEEQRINNLRWRRHFQRLYQRWKCSDHLVCPCHLQDLCQVMFREGWTLFWLDHDWWHHDLWRHANWMTSHINQNRRTVNGCSKYLFYFLKKKKDMNLYFYLSACMTRLPFLSTPTAMNFEISVDIGSFTDKHERDYTNNTKPCSSFLPFPSIQSLEIILLKLRIYT